MQSLKEECGYYNRGDHGLGYDLNGVFDLGKGLRGKQSKGLSIQGTANAVYHGDHSYVTPDEVINIAMNVGNSEKVESSDGVKPASRKKLQRVPRHLSREANLRRRLREEENSLEKDRYFERARVLREIVQRHGQPQFRRTLLQAYGTQCVVSGCQCEWALEAAHIVPYSDGGKDDAANGLLLRADIHTLFDLNLIGADPISRKIIVHQTLQNTEYAKFNGRRLLKPKNKQLTPKETALQARWAQFKEGRPNDRSDHA
jgi:hypothetical protein